MATRAGSDDRRWKPFEAISADQLGLLTKFYDTAPGTNPRRVWGRIARARLQLAVGHLATAESFVGDRTEGQLRSVISRAYYAMFCAARGALGLFERGDMDGHQQLPGRLASSSLGKKDDRVLVAGALNKFRALRNEADYSPFYPAVLDRDAAEAVKTARACVRICRRWVRDTTRSSK